MRSNGSLGVSALVIAVLLVGVLPMASPARDAKGVLSTSQDVDPAIGQDVSAVLGGLPTTFEANVGQAGERAKFLSRGNGYTLFLEDTGAVLALDGPSRSDLRTSVRMTFLGAEDHPAIAGIDLRPGKVNYLLGNDPAKWHTDVPTYARVRYDDVYPCIDVVYYGNRGQLEYDFLVAPGANPGVIRIGFEGADGLRVDQEGSLLVSVGDVQLRLSRPVAYQDVGGLRHYVPARFVVGGTALSLAVGAYDRTQLLVIDPTLGYSTFLGGTSEDEGYDIALDSIGNVYVTGLTWDFASWSSSYYSIGPVAYPDAFVAKLRPLGNGQGDLIFLTFLGGSSLDYGRGIAVDPAGNVYVAGTTVSWYDFPTTLGAFETSPYDPGGLNSWGFVSKLDAAGSNLVYSSFMGGGYAMPSDIALDSDGFVYATGCARIGFFTTPGAYDPNPETEPSIDDVFLAKLNLAGNGLGDVVYSTFIGDHIYRECDFQSWGPWGGHSGPTIAVDSAGRAFIAGSTFPGGDPPGSFPTTYGAYWNPDASSWWGGGSFVSVINPDPDSGDNDGDGLDESDLVYSTIFQSCGYCSLLGDLTDIAVDDSFHVYLTGPGSHFPTTPGAYRDDGEGILMVLDATPYPLDPDSPDADIDGNGWLDSDSDDLLYSTRLGYSSPTSGIDVGIDAAGFAYLTGDTGFLMKIDPSGNGNAGLLALYPGFGDWETYGLGIVVGPAGSAYVTGWTSSTGFTITPTPGAFDNTLSNGHVDPEGNPIKDAFVRKFCTSPDDDCDGIYDVVDTNTADPLTVHVAPSTWSDVFDDITGPTVYDGLTSPTSGGNTQGMIADRNDNLVFVEYAPNLVPTGGMMVSVRGPQSNGDSVLYACPEPYDPLSLGYPILMPPNTERPASCPINSLHLGMGEGTVTVDLNGIPVVIPGAAAATLSMTQPGMVQVTNDPRSTADVTIGGVPLPPGESTIVVINDPPSVAITGPASGSVYAIGTPVTFTGTFADPDSSMHTAEWTFVSGEDTITWAGTVSEIDGTVTATYAFASAGVYKVSLTVTDDAGGSGVADTIGDLPAMVVVYDPSAGFVTGGGWIPSPEGAWTQDPSLTGKASFGFVSKYQRGAKVPTGTTEFQFKVADLNFHSTAYDWLVCGGAKCQFKGTGTINGQGTYGFLLTAVDGQLQGGGGADRLRMKIWDLATNVIVYDSQPGADDSADPTTVLGGGSIVIHKG